MHHLSADHSRVALLHPNTVVTLFKLEFGLLEEFLHDCSDETVVQFPVDVATGVGYDTEGDLLHLVDDELSTAGKTAVELQDGEKEVYIWTLRT